MAGAAVDIGTGATVTFTTSSWAANITALRHTGIERVAVQTSHLGTTNWHTKIGGDLTNPGQLEIDYQMSTASSATTGVKLPPITGGKVAETVTIEFPATTATGMTIAGSAFVTSMSYEVPLEDVITGSFTVDFSGALSFTLPG